MIRKFMLVACALAVAWLVDASNAQSAYATTYYVDGSCSANGTGTGDGCAASAGASGAFRDPQSCFSAVRAGDTCLIKNGTYVTASAGGDVSVSGGFSVGASGTASLPITIKNYPGHSPLLANCPPSQTSYCPRPTITAPSRQYVTVEGLRIHGGIWIYGVSESVNQGSRGMIFRNNEIDTGWGEVDDGNWAGIFIDGQSGAQFTNNYLHDIYVPSGGGSQSSGGCIKLYYNNDVVVEKNTCARVNIPESQAGGIDDKAHGTRNIHRYNLIQGVNSCIRVNNQIGAAPVSGVKIYGNICIGGAGTQRPALRLTMNIGDIEIFNNTLYGFAQGVMTEEGPVNGVRLYNNIFANITDNNLELYSMSGSAYSYNTYSPIAAAPKYYWLSTWQSTLGNFQAASGLDTTSNEIDCQLTSPGTDFHLRSGSACAGTGRAGGTSAGAPLDRGAYGVTSCVGHTCGGSAPVPPPPGTSLPSAPSGVHIVSD
jgi:hypothetical protein